MCCGLMFRANSLHGEHLAKCKIISDSRQYDDFVMTGFGKLICARRFPEDLTRIFRPVERGRGALLESLRTVSGRTRGLADSIMVYTYRHSFS